MRTGIELREIHTAKVKQTTPQYDKVALFQIQDPKIFGVNYYNVKTFNNWDGGDGVDGVYNTISLRMEDWVLSLTITIEHMFEMHSTARSLCLELLSLTVDFFRKMSSIMQILYHELMVKTFSSDHPGKNTWQSVGRLY